MSNAVAQDNTDVSNEDEQVDQRGNDADDNGTESVDRQHGGDDAAHERNDDEDGNDSGDDKKSRQDRRYRAELRESEKRVEALQRQIVDSFVDAEGIERAAFWAGVSDIGQLIADDGSVSKDAVVEAVSEVRQTFGIPVGPRRPAVDSALGRGIDDSSGGGADWTAAFGPKEE